MLNELIDSGAGLVILVIGIVFGGIGLAVAFSIAGQIVQNSGYAPLQTTYQHSSEAINTATDFKDKYDLGIAALFVIGALIAVIIGIVKYL